MIEIINEPAFLSRYPGQRTKWTCARCMREVPDETEYVSADGVREAFRSSDLVRNSEIVERVSTFRLYIIIVTAALAGGMVVFSFDRATLFPLVTFFDVFFDITCVLAALLVYGFGAIVLGVIADCVLTPIIRRRADREMRSRRQAEQSATDPTGE
jgi:hypothetical protein